MKVRELPEYVGVAQSMTDFFSPEEDAKDDEVLVRRGLIESKYSGVVNGVMLFTTKDSEWGINWAFYKNNGSGWIEEVDIVTNPDIEDVLKTYLV